jgi:glucose/arabinose dehydrogenase
MKHLYLFLAVICLLVPSRAPAQPQLQTRDVITGLTVPWEILWGPDNWIWMTERGGRISRVNPETGEQKVLITISEVSAIGESGLLGMTLHPSFADTPQVFVVYTYRVGIPMYEKLVRYTYDGTTLINPTVLVENIVANSTHDGSRLVILPDRTLVMTTGDSGSGPQSHTSRSGKILRLNLDGTAPADNPYAGAPYPANILWTTGHRNPQGLVYAPNGILYSSEHGASSDDEINIILKGRNYGWSNVQGFCNDGGAAEAKFCTDSNVVEPIKAWTPTIAPAGIDYYNNTAIPEWQNSLLLVTLNSRGSDLRQLKLNSGGTQITSETILYDNTWGRLRDLCIAPDGRVFICTSNKDGRGTPRTGDDRIIELRAASSATITTGIIPTPLIAGEKIGVPFTATGTFNAGNIFTAEISDANGSFDSPQTIGTVTGTGSGTIDATIPCGTDGNGFRIRVVSNSPGVIGSDNGQNISIINSLYVALPLDNETICEGDSTQITPATVGAISSYTWRPSAGLSCSDCRSPVASPATTTTYILEVTNGWGCMMEDSIQIIVNPTPHPTITRNGTILTSSTAISYQWLHNGTPIDGAIEQSYTATTSGWYRVRATSSGGCIGMSDSVQVLMSSVLNEQPADAALRLFPDPAKDQLTIEVTNLPRGIALFRVIDLSGKVVLQEEQKSSGGSLNHHLDISALPSGVYLLEVQSGDKRWQRKFVRE